MRLRSLLRLRRCCYSACCCAAGCARRCLACSAPRGSLAHGSVESALIWTPPIASEGRLLRICLLAALTLLLILSLLAPVFVALLLSGPATALVIWLLLWAEEQRYVAALDRALPAAVGRLAAQLRSGSGIQPALERYVVSDLADGPLKAEWQFIITHFGAPLGGALATPQQVVAALVAQPSRRHAALLGHMEVALTQTHDVLVKRLQAAYAALLAAEQRRSQAGNPDALQQRGDRPGWYGHGCLPRADSVAALHARLPGPAWAGRWPGGRDGPARTVCRWLSARPRR